MPLDQPPAPPPAAEQPFDLARIAPPPGMDLHAVHRGCPPGKPGEIVVCAADPEKDRLRTPTGDHAAEDGLPRAEVGIGHGASLGATVEAAAMPNGMVSNRVMVTGKITF